MRILRICLHSLVLTVANIGFIIVGFGVYHLLKPVNQIAIQAPVAAILCITAFVVWSLFIPRLPFKGLPLQGTSELAWVYLAALLWSPIVFVPLHYITQGYLTSVGNILATWFFQLPVNFLAILTANILARIGNKAAESVPTSASTG